jgi:hypothetical protein
MIHQNDDLIPANVAQADNFYQSNSRTDFSTASPRFGPPIRHVRVSLGIFDSTTKRARIIATTIPGTTASREVSHPDRMRSEGVETSGVSDTVRPAPTTGNRPAP